MFVVYYQRLPAEVDCKTPLTGRTSLTPPLPNHRDYYTEPVRALNVLSERERKLQTTLGNQKGRRAGKHKTTDRQGSQRAGQHYHRRSNPGEASPRLSLPQAPHQCLPLPNSTGPSFASAPCLLLLQLAASTSVTF